MAYPTRQEIRAEADRYRAIVTRELFDAAVAGGAAYCYQQANIALLAGDMLRHSAYLFAAWLLSPCGERLK